MQNRYFFLFIFLPLFLFAQNFTNGFEFYLPPDDSTTQEFLPAFPKNPIGENDFISINNDGHFSANGDRIRFFGTNFTTDGAFPIKTKAHFIAGRLRKMGYNLVRFHHMDNGWSQHSLFVRGQGTRALNPETLDRFENMIYHLKQNGVYANINLHVSRTVEEQDGIVDADSIPDFSKGVTYFDPQFLTLHKEFAAQLLTHQNPYTGMSLAEDPVMAMVEITNENSLYRMWRSDQLKHFSEGGKLTKYHTKMLDEQFNDYLAEQYASTDELRAAWNIGTRPAGAGEQIKDSGFENDPLSRNWTMELHEGSQAQMSIVNTDPYAGAKCAQVEVTNATGTSWHIQWKQINITIKKDSLYTVSFAGRADASRPVSVVLQRNSSPYEVFYSSGFQLGPAWKVYEFSFASQTTITNGVKLSISLGSEKGIYYFDEIHMYPSAINGLAADESLDEKTVRRIDYTDAVNFSDARVRDMSEFIASRQINYFNEMVDHLKNTLGLKVPIVGTNWNVGPGDLAIQSRLDYIDNHAYWDHPQFPNVSWDSQDWLINNTPMVRSDDGGTIASLMAGVPSVGKPFTISEYNHPTPNRYQTEGVLFLTAYSAFHDADGYMFFDYPSSYDDWETDKINGYFTQHRNTAMMALMPSCAAAFRQGLIKSAQQTLMLNYSDNDISLLPKKDGQDWRGPNWYPRKLALRHAVRNESFTSATDFDPASLPAEPSNPYITDTDEIEWNTDGLLQVRTDQFVAATGFLPDFKNTKIGDMTLMDASDFATLTWLSLTDDPLRQSERSVFTISTRVQNTGMLWDGAKTIHNNWGHAPTEMYPITLQVEFYIQADSILVYPLDEQGAQTNVLLSYQPSGVNTFTVEFDQTKTPTVWFGIEKFGVGTMVESKDTAPNQFELLQNYPNPFNPNTTITYHIPKNGHVTLEVFDIRGRLQKMLVDKNEVAGEHAIELDTAGWSSGTYLYRLSMDNLSIVRKMLLIQ